MIDGFFYKNIFIESKEVELKNNKISTSFFDIDINEFSVNNIKLKENTAYDKNLTSYPLETILSQKNSEFYFYKIKGLKIFEKEYKNLYSNIEIALRDFEQISDNPINNMIINELIINAYEHGNLEIDFKTKNNLILANKYLDHLKQKEKLINKFFIITIYEYNDFIFVYIKDEGNRFNIKTIKPNISNGRGFILISKKSFKFFYSLIENEFCVILKSNEIKSRFS